MANDQMRQMSFDEWHDLHPDKRAEVYAGLFLAMELAANNGEPNPLSDDEMSLIGYGLFRDSEVAQEGWLRFDNPEGTSSKAIPLSDFYTYENVIKLMDATNDPRLELERTDTGEATVGKWDTIEEEGLYVPILVGALTLGAGGIAASGTAGATLVQTTSASIKWLPSTIFSVLRTAAGTKVGSAVVGVSLGMAGTAGVLGTAGLAASLADNVVNYDVNYRAQMDAQAIQMSSMVTPVELHEQQVAVAGMPLALGAREATLTPEETERVMQGEQPRITQASLYAQSSPVPPAPTEETFADDPWFGGFSELYDPTAGRHDYWEEVGAPSHDPRKQRRVIRMERLVPDPETGELGLRYRTSDYERKIAQMSPGMLVWFQNMAQSALLINLGESDFGTRAVPGIMDDATKKALAQVMVQANTDGTTWHEAARRMAEAGQEWKKAYEEANAPAPRIYTKPAFLPKDWAEIAQDAKATVEGRLGRKINDWELELLADQFRVYERQEYDAAAEAHRAAWEAEGRAIDTGENQAEGTYPQVNAEARLAEFFDEKFANELDRVDRVADVYRKTGSLMQGFDNAASIVGGR